MDKCVTLERTPTTLYGKIVRCYASPWVGDLLQTTVANSQKFIHYAMFQSSSHIIKNTVMFAVYVGCAKEILLDFMLPNTAFYLQCKSFYGFVYSPDWDDPE